MKINLDSETQAFLYEQANKEGCSGASYAYAILKNHVKYMKSKSTNVEAHEQLETETNKNV